MIELFLWLHTLMDTIFQTGTIRCDMHLFLNVSFSLGFQIGCSGFSETETHSLLFVLYCLPNHVGFVAVLLVCALLIKFPVAKFIVFIEQKRERYMQNNFCLINVFMSIWESFACYIAGLYSSRPTSDPPCREVICLHVRAVLSPACPLCLLIASHYHSAIWTAMMWLAASFYIRFPISSASFIQPALLQPFLIVSLWLLLHV